MMKDYLTTAMAAKILGFTTNYVRRLILKGEIKAEKWGYDWTIKKDAIKHIKRRREPNRE